MSKEIGRRELIGAVGAAAITTTVVSTAAGAAEPAPRKLIGVSCSPRKGKTTAAALTVCLDAARKHIEGLETELIELADLSIPAQLAAGLPLRDGETDDFPSLVPILGDPRVKGIIVGSPVYFGNMSALCKAFLDRCIAFRRDGFKLRNKVAGVLAVGGTRNGGQEMTVRTIQTALMSQDMIIAGTGAPSARIGATLWSQDNTIENDDFGTATAVGLGQRVAELAAMIGG